MTVIVGGGGFLLIYALAWKALHNRTGARGDSRLEALAYYYLWGIFALTYAGSSPLGLRHLTSERARMRANRAYDSGGGL